MKENDLKRLEECFLREKRSFPWRNNPDPYMVWVSEVMLQQTRAPVVVPYFLRWISLFPSINALAAAPIETVIKCWEGLGYYSRARNLHEGARRIVAEWGGVIPDDEKALASLKGLGPYTVGAIRSFAFRKRCPAVDGNVIRLLSRYYAIEGDTGSERVRRTIREAALALLPEEHSEIINEALIELGATICGRKARCSECPLQEGCKAYADNTVSLFPQKSARCKIEKLHRAVAVIRLSEGEVLVRKQEPHALMGEVREFPYVSIEPEEALEGLREQLLHQFDHLPVYEGALPIVSHSFTRYQAVLYPHCFTATKKVSLPDHEWLSVRQLDQNAFSSGHRRIYADWKKDMYTPEEL